ncbi:ornithine cyclodeaminase [Thiotrichales bacterium 19S11-10]|nr:ornithine cyclodeaminase [Thiotrichales bacterium 19S11-10]MCF6807065.1 ornithine cyclodeaminase [Thiotrichales bacterium 19S9-11]MCF6811034.1 ornithine cyclodeaminase [Thiotrichales bacterium 19S9-12]
MVTLLSVEALTELVKRHSLNAFFLDLIDYLKADFARWHDFDKMPRPAFHVPGGVIELMPISDQEYFSFKYVNGHPNNPLSNKQTVIATGQLSKVKDGYPVLMTEMTLLTALRTAATAAIASDLLARKDSTVLTLIGTGAQSDFQVLAHRLIRDIQTVRYYDTDEKAMDRFERNMASYGFELIRCKDHEDAVKGADIITVCTACKKHVDVIKDQWIKPGMHINGLGGDCPGKTELELSILERTKTVVEYFDQSFIEGEIQRYSLDEAKVHVYAELWEIITNQKEGRISDDEITLFDSVGIALEDFSALRLTYQLSQDYQIGEIINMVPPLEDPKDLFSVFKNANISANIPKKVTII